MQLKVKFTCFYEEEVRISLISEDNLFSVIKNKEIYFVEDNLIFI